MNAPIRGQAQNTTLFAPPKGSLHIRRQVASVVAVILTTLFASAAIIFLTYLIVYIARQGLRFLNLDFFTQPPAALGEVGGGVQQAIIGSLIIVGLASLFGIPLGLFTGIYLAEFGRGWLAAVLRFLVDMLTGIPTIIFGLFIWVLIVVPTHSFSGLAGGLALGIIMIPTVARATEEILRLVPKELREASIALGATESRTIFRVVVPAAMSGIITGVMLALARVAGETAPLLMTAFGSQFFNVDITRPMAALPLQVFNYTLSPYDTQINQAYAGSFVLMLLVIVTSLAVRWATGGFKARR
ncbi:MAG TPA: phosphate ABC transporter permease PstA [Ktedonobacterales bacterium]|nr:phosphate ABC transporter permease PstA [Ktedonobacterales bacterium]